MKRILLALAVLAVALPQTAQAQTGARLTLRDLQTEAFPFITGYFDARDASGARLADLQPADLEVLEDGTPQPVQQLQTVSPGVRVILVISPGESFNIHNAEAQSRYDLVKQALDSWATALPSNSGTLLSLVTPDGTLVHDALASEWLAALDSYQLSTGALPPQSLSSALELAAQPAPQPGMSTAIWWVTATPALTALPDAQTLEQAGVPLFVWQVDAPSTFTSSASQSLQSLAEASGGSRFTYSGIEVFPAPETYFSSLRDVFFFQYSSQLRTAGDHQIALQLKTESGDLVSPALTINLNIQPPSPVLVAPPSQISRVPSQQDPQQLAPFSQPIEFTVDFPDGFQRNLVRSTLYVNDEAVAENTTAPFTHFAWDLNGYTESQRVMLRVEVEDELGLVGSSIELPVDFNVQAPVGWFQALLARGASALALSVVLIAAGAFFLVMVLSGRLDTSRWRLTRRGRARRPEIARPADPLSDAPEGLETAEVSHLASAPDPALQAPAYLQRLAMQDPTQPAFMQPLGDEEVVIGSDPACNLVLTDSSVDKQHARVGLDPEGEFHIADLGSHAGTWVNYAPVSSGGSHLRDGDIVHIGRVAFRFLLNHANDEPAN